MTIKQSLPRPLRSSLAAAAILASVLGTTSMTASAAPLDTLMTADMPGGPSQRYMFEAAGDFLNRTLDPFHIAGSTSASYTGGHLRAALRLSPNWWISGAYWRRDLNYGGDSNSINTWQIAVNRILGHLAPADTTVAARLSLWGDWGDALTRTAPISAFGTTASDVGIDRPRDIQAQFDLVASGRLGPHNGFNVFAGVGGSRVSASQLSANINQGTCRFHVNVNDQDQASASLLAPCKVGNSTLSQANFSGDSRNFGFDFDRGFIYRSAYVSAGASWDWHDGPFGALLGYRFQYLWRSDVDSSMESYGLTPVRSQHDVIAQVSYAVTKNVSVFARGQVYAHGQVGDLPLAYNVATGSRQDRAVGIASFGVVISGF